MSTFGLLIFVSQRELAHQTYDVLHHYAEALRSAGGEIKETPKGEALFIISQLLSSLGHPRLRTILSIGGTAIRDQVEGIRR